MPFLYVPNLSPSCTKIKVRSKQAEIRVTEAFGDLSMSVKTEGKARKPEAELGETVTGEMIHADESR